MKCQLLALAVAIAALLVSFQPCVAETDDSIEIGTVVFKPVDGFRIDSMGFCAEVPQTAEQQEVAILVLPETKTLSSNTQPRSMGMWAGNPGKFFQGAFVALLGHEAGHYVANWSIGSHPYIKSVNYGPIPFFTIEPNRTLNKREHYITASAGFTGQHIVNEWLLTRHPNLKDEDKPFLKGLAAFNFWLTVGYAATAFAGTGPDERDTKGMADSIGWNEPYIGALILVPTALDTYRYKHPDAKWAKTASRVSKLAIVLLALTIDD